ncbi:TerC family protein [Prochlorococcus sp. MIT 1300]|uniref:TerC family protein n=1 Tax=Prochlorococcus sp. MIT 1300 TaxID=3096218 RepID=UPI002A762EFD|nr:hypothetical protein [Prochlorococcus sp. MIT 1300]
MDSAALESLGPLLDGVDKWAELAPLLPVLVSLEIVLSADNAIALAAIARSQGSLESQRWALNIGILLALVLRIILILTANLVLKYPIIQLVAGLYLTSIFVRKLISTENSEISKENDGDEPRNTSVSMLKTVILLALTDLAFSIDSVAAAVAISDQLLLVITGAIIGVLALRFTSGLFVGWLEEFTRLEMAGYLAVGFVGFKLIVLLLFTGITIPQWLVMTIIILLFAWGFSKRTDYTLP